MRKHTPPVPSTPFMNVRDAARATGLSEYYLRKELAKGTIPHLKSGRCIHDQRPRPAGAAGCAAEIKRRHPHEILYPRL